MNLALESVRIKKALNKRRHCAKKVGHHSVADAQREIDRLVALGRSKDPAMFRAYLCDYCDDYHIGHKRRKP